MMSGLTTEANLVWIGSRRALVNSHKSTAPTDMNHCRPLFAFFFFFNQLRTLHALLNIVGIALFESRMCMVWRFCSPFAESIVIISLYLGMYMLPKVV
ncbi:hypothetical protein BCR42DRAFT_420934 [Absidia repens]|uniref:Uncharacterized protein n=1 Tax=Absidia repens TaxID=90262 RepID=A0A1X2I942_9FUNG|nr:hypothetical protein BCR42DRAFT_420934 [Absidia repens]